MLAAASAAGMGVGCSNGANAGRSTAPGNLYEVAPFGNVSLLHFTTAMPSLSRFISASPRSTSASALGRKAPHLVGEALLKSFKIAPSSIEAHAFTYLNLTSRAYVRQGRRLCTPRHLVKSLRDQRKGRTLLLDGGDTWQGSGTSLWTRVRTWWMPASCSAWTS